MSEKDTRRETVKPVIWTDELYRYAEHYYQEPNRLEKQSIPDITLNKVYASIRSTEFPLNTLFVILLRLLPFAIVHRLLQTLDGGAYVADGDKLRLFDVVELVESKLGNLTQPDVVLESRDSRIASN